MDITNPINWTIKNISETAKDHALTQAQAAGVPVGIWLEKLLLAHREGSSLPSGNAPKVDLRQLAEVMRASADIMQVTGTPIPKAAVKNAYSLLGQELRQTKQMLRKEPIQQPRQRQIKSDHQSAASPSSTVSGTGAGSASSGITPAIANSEV